MNVLCLTSYLLLQFGTEEDMQKSFPNEVATRIYKYYKDTVSAATRAHGSLLSP
jgi:hypothetical protein